MGSDEVRRKEIREAFLKEVVFEMGPGDWENFHWLVIRAGGTNRPAI